MNALEWSPAFGPIAFTVLALGAGLLFAALFRRLSARQGVRHAWTILSPKIILVLLLVLALLDPAWKSARWNSSPAKVIVLQDVSASMDLRDDGSARSDRATRVIRQLQSSAPANIRFQVLPFDTTVREAGYKSKAGAERGTDLASIFLAVSDQGSLAGADGVIVVTDGGDEAVTIAKLPAMPLAIVGVGTPVESWNDLGIGTVNAPTSIEEGSEFDIETELYARSGALSRSRDALGALKISLEEYRDKKWTEVQSKTADLRSLHGMAVFHVKPTGSGALRYRVRVPGLPGELTLVNNQRTLNVQIQRRALHVLYFTQELGADYKYLRAELGSDPGIAFTAMYRVQEDKFTVQGDRTGFEELERGFPTDDAVLKRYDCLIFGSFAANLLTDQQTQALLRYVSGGGALVLLGGESSFGRGGYAESKLAPLMPWAVVKNEPDLATGNFPLSLSVSASSVGFTTGWRETLTAAGGGALDSVNQPGNLRPGAMALLDVSVANRLQPVVALQRYGKGQILGIASNTLWRWAASGQGLKTFYGKFWRQSVRGLTQKIEGGSLLGIRWDKDHYRPGEEATVEVRVQGAADSGAVRLAGALNGPDGNSDINLAPVAGQPGFYTAKISLPKRSDYQFKVTAYAGAQVAETYERTLSVEPLVEEGANPELKEAYLRDIATRAKGVYASENDVDAVKTFLRERMISEQSPLALPLVDIWNLFITVVLVVLVVEWVLRRRLNLI